MGSTSPEQVDPGTCLPAPRTGAPAPRELPSKQDCLGVVSTTGCPGWGDPAGDYLAGIHVKGMSSACSRKSQEGLLDRGWGVEFGSRRGWIPMSGPSRSHAFPVREGGPVPGRL